MGDQRKEYADPKRFPERNRSKNYRPITCLLIIWKILTAQIREESYDYQKTVDCSPRSRKDAVNGPDA